MSKKNKSTVKNSSMAKVSETEATAMQLIIQSPSGQEITPEDVRAKISSSVGSVEKVYVRPDEGKAYWVRGEGEKEEHGAIELW